MSAIALYARKTDGFDSKQADLLLTNRVTNLEILDPLSLPPLFVSGVLGPSFPASNSATRPRLEDWLTSLELL